MAKAKSYAVFSCQDVFFVGGDFLKIVDIQPIIEKYKDFEEYTHHFEYDNGVTTGVIKIVDELERLKGFDNLDSLYELSRKYELAIKDLRKVSVCGTCINYIPNGKTSNCKIRNRITGQNYAGCSRWKWRYE